MKHFSPVVLLFAVLVSKAHSFAHGSKLSRKNLVGYNHGRNLRQSLTFSAYDITTLELEDVIPRSILISFVFAVCFRLGAWFAVLGYPRLPDDDSDACRVVSKVVHLPNLKSRVRLFYPCPNQNVDECLTTESKYCTDGIKTSNAIAGMLGLRQLGLSFLLQHLADAKSGCYEEKNGASCHLISRDSKYPLLVYSHGYGGNMDMATYFLRGFALQGMVIAIIEHADGTATSTVLSDGSRLNFHPFRLSLRDSLQFRSKEIHEAVDYLPSLFPGCLDRIFVGGHSYGATSALIASQERSHGISGLILHDPALKMGAGCLELPTKIPTVSYVSDEYCWAGVRCGDATYHVHGAFHCNFLDIPFWAPLWILRLISLTSRAAGPVNPVKVHQQLAKSAKAFAKDPLGMEGVEQSLFELVQ